MNTRQISKIALLVALSAGSGLASAAPETSSQKDMIINDEFLNEGADAISESESSAAGRASATRETRSASADLQSTTSNTENSSAETSHVVNFEFDSAELTDEAKRSLQPLVDQLQQDEQAAIVGIAGYTDATGPEEYNRDLAQRRAEAVKEHFTQQDVSVRSWEVDAIGEDQPIASNDSAQGRQENRRVEIQLRPDQLGSR